jgi:hypothetical protein
MRQWQSAIDGITQNSVCLFAPKGGIAVSVFFRVL